MDALPPQRKHFGSAVGRRYKYSPQRPRRSRNRVSAATEGGIATERVVYEILQSSCAFVDENGNEEDTITDSASLTVLGQHVRKSGANRVCLEGPDMLPRERMQIRQAERKREVKVILPRGICGIAAFALEVTSDWLLLFSQLKMAL